MSFEDDIINLIKETDPEQTEVFYQVVALISHSGKRLQRKKIEHFINGDNRLPIDLIKLYNHPNWHTYKLTSEDISIIFFICCALKLAAGETHLTFKRSIVEVRFSYNLDEKYYRLNLDQVSLLDLSRVKSLTLDQLSPTDMLELISLATDKLKKVHIVRAALNADLIKALGEANVVVKFKDLKRLSTDELELALHYPKVFKGIKEASSHLDTINEWSEWQSTYLNHLKETFDQSLYKQGLLVGERIATLVPQNINGVELRMIYCPRGGKLLRSFLMSETLVTRGFYDKVQKQSSCPSDQIDNPKEFRWIEAIRFCNELSQQQGLTPVYTIGSLSKNRVYAINLDLDANGYRLPLSAEWTYAASARKDFLYAGSDSPGDVAHFGRDNRPNIPNVASLAPNSWGFFDQSGLLQEICYDYAGSNGRMTNDPMTDRARGVMRVMRGGRLSSSPEYCLIDKIDECHIDYRALALRLVRSYQSAD